MPNIKRTLVAGVDQIIPVSGNFVYLETATDEVNITIEDSVEGTITLKAGQGQRIIKDFSQLSINSATNQNIILVVMSANSSFIDNRSVGVTTSTPAEITSYVAAAKVSLADTATQVIPAAAGRRMLLIKAQRGNVGSLWIDDLDTGIELSAGESIPLADVTCAVTVYSQTAGADNVLQYIEFFS